MRNTVYSIELYMNTSVLKYFSMKLISMGYDDKVVATVKKRIHRNPLQVKEINQ